jgi:sigma-B regulation protein RsbU (phosphoserine phosphatase)
MSTEPVADKAGKGRLLIVDDSARIRLLLQHRLSAEGYTVEIAEDGSQGFEAAQAFLPDVIVSDLMMPGVDGQELCARIRADDDLRGCYIIVLTGRDSQDARLGALASGADDFVVKPWDERELLARIHTGMRIRSLQREIQLKEQRDVLAKLAVTMAHEINNPLTGLIFELQVLQMDEKLSSRGGDSLKCALGLAQRIAEIVRRVQSVDVAATKEYESGIQMFDLASNDAQSAAEKEAGVIVRKRRKES